MLVSFMSIWLKLEWFLEERFSFERNVPARLNLGYFLNWWLLWEGPSYYGCSAPWQVVLDCTRKQVEQSMKNKQVSSISPWHLLHFFCLDSWPSWVSAWFPSVMGCGQRCISWNISYWYIAFGHGVFFTVLETQDKLQMQWYIFISTLPYNQI